MGSPLAMPGDLATNNSCRAIKAVNAPRCPVHHYQRDGAMAGSVEIQVDPGQPDGAVNFYPNHRLDACRPRPDLAPPILPLTEDTSVGVHSQKQQDYVEQADALCRIMTEQQKDALAKNPGVKALLL